MMTLRIQDLNINTFPSLILVSMMLASCSVYQASSDEGISPDCVIASKNRTDLLSCGMDLISARTLPDGKYLETYRGLASKSGLNYLRALGYGTLDVLTLGIWEAAGTPIEGAISKEGRRYILATILYPRKGSTIVEQIRFYTP